MSDYQHKQNKKLVSVKRDLNSFVINNRGAIVAYMTKVMDSETGDILYIADEDFLNEYAPIENADIDSKSEAAESNSTESNSEVNSESEAEEIHSTYHANNPAAT